MIELSDFDLPEMPPRSQKKFALIDPQELEALRAIVKELASKDAEVYADDGFCIFCGETGKHEADCLVERAKGLVKA